MAFLNQRRRLTALSKLGALYWAWIPVSAPPIVRENIWGEDPPPAWGKPRVQPEQIRLMTYLALASGYRGLGFLGDAELTRPAGQANLIELAFLNEEIDLFESILARSADPIPTYNVYDPDPPDIPPPGFPVGFRMRPQKEMVPRPNLLAAAISVERKGALLLVADYAAMAQYQPPQMASHNLLIRPALPESAQAYEISPGEVKVLDRVRVPHGTQITLPEFSTTTMILCTTDTALVERVQAAIAPVRPLAVQLAIEQAEILYQAALEINDRLAADGQYLLGPDDHKRRSDAGMVSRPTDERDLLAKAEASIKAAREAREREDFALAWAEARRAERPLRHLMHGHWLRGYAAFVKAVLDSYPKVNPEEKPGRYSSAEVKKKKEDELKNKKKPDIPILIKPISCPPSVGVSTLPELYFWIDWIGGKKGFKFGDNRVPTGSFDDPEAMTEAGWQNVNYQVDGIKAKMTTVPRKDSKTDRVIRMRVESADRAELDTTAPQFFDFPVAAVRSPAIKVQAKNLIRISVLVKKSAASAPAWAGSSCEIPSAANSFSTGPPISSSRTRVWSFTARRPPTWISPSPWVWPATVRRTSMIFASSSWKPTTSNPAPSSPIVREPANPALPLPLPPIPRCRPPRPVLAKRGGRGANRTLLTPIASDTRFPDWKNRRCAYPARDSLSGD